MTSLAIVTPLGVTLAVGRTLGKLALHILEDVTGFLDSFLSHSQALFEAADIISAMAADLAAAGVGLRIAICFSDCVCLCSRFSAASAPSLGTEMESISKILGGNQVRTAIIRK